MTLAVMGVVLVVVHLWHSYYESYLVNKTAPVAWYVMAVYKFTDLVQTAIIIILALVMIMKFIEKAAPLA